MGRKRVTQLLEQLKDNQQQELQNAAAIFTVAQVAVQQLQEQIDTNLQPDEIEVLPPALPTLPFRGLPISSPIVPVSLSEAELRQRYGSHSECRKAAKERGIKFRKNPTWQQLAAAFSYIEACDQVIQSYIAAYPNPELVGVSFELKIN